MIYVEDQYFWSDVVAGTLADALRREPDLQVIAVVPRFSEDEGGSVVRRRTTASGSRGTSCARRAATGSRCSTSRTPQVRRSTSTPRSASSTTSG